jgi:hypothetical protein
VLSGIATDFGRGEFFDEETGGDIPMGGSLRPLGVSGVRKFSLSSLSTSISCDLFRKFVLSFEGVLRLWLGLSTLMGIERLMLEMYGELKTSSTSKLCF